MWTDPIVDEVRQVRDAFASSFQYDIRKMAAALHADACAGKFEEMLKGGNKRVLQNTKTEMAEIAGSKP